MCSVINNELVEENVLIRWIKDGNVNVNTYVKVAKVQLISFKNHQLRG